MISDIYQQKKTVFSLEIFPPKNDADFSNIFRTIDDLKNLNPDYISITYGAGGSTNKKTMDIASYVKNKCNIEALAHLTCASLDEQLLYKFLKELDENHIDNVLALRGDRPQDMSEEVFKKRPYQYASDLVTIIKRNSKICIGGACYPEIHPESLNQKNDLNYLRSKVDTGMQFLITQLFFDNTKFFTFFDLARDNGISVPISAGIMPITSPKQIHTIVALSNASIPPALAALFDKYQDNADDFKKAGLDYAIKQIMDLIDFGVQGIHLFTLNKVDISTAIMNNLTGI